MNRSFPHHTHDDPATWEAAGPCAPPWHAAEAAVLGAALYHVTYARGVVETLTADAFDRHAHRIIFEAVSALLDAGHVPDPVTVTSLLAAHGQLEEAGDAQALYDLVRFVPDPSAWRSYAAVVKHAADRRRRIHDLLAELRDLGVTIEEAS